MAKGSSFERLICDRLSLWWTGDADASVFWRSSNSGGRATVRSRKGKRTDHHHGDIASTDPSSAPFTELLVAECKKGYNRLTIADMLDKPKPVKGKMVKVFPKKGKAPASYQEWFRKVRVSQRATGAFSWLLIHRRDRREPVVFFSQRLRSALNQHCKQAAFKEDQSPFLSFRMNCPEEGIFVVQAMPLEDFLAAVRPDDVRELCRLKREGKL